MKVHVRWGIGNCRYLEKKSNRISSLFLEKFDGQIVFVFINLLLLLCSLSFAMHLFLAISMLNFLVWVYLFVRFVSFWSFSCPFDLCFCVYCVNLDFLINLVFNVNFWFWSILWYVFSLIFPCVLDFRRVLFFKRLNFLSNKVVLDFWEASFDDMRNMYSLSWDNTNFL